MCRFPGQSTEVSVTSWPLSLDPLCTGIQGRLSEYTISIGNIMLVKTNWLQFDCGTTEFANVHYAPTSCTEKWEYSFLLEEAKGAFDRLRTHDWPIICQTFYPPRHNAPKVDFYSSVIKLQKDSILTSQTKYMFNPLLVLYSIG